MNDRYLFKAKRLDNGEWVQGALFDGENRCLIGQEIKFSPYVENECKIVGYEVDRTTISQCECEKPKTNADRIRSMSDEELAEIIMCPYNTEGKSIDDMLCAEHGTQMLVTPGECIKCCIKWLQSELEE